MNETNVDDRKVKRNRLALADDEKAGLDQLVQMSDDEIDLSDVPDITAEQMGRAVKRINEQVVSC